MFAAEKADCGPLGELVSDLADKHVSSKSRGFEGTHEISVHEPEGRINGGVFGFRGVSQLILFRHRTDVTVRREPSNATPLPFFLLTSLRLRSLK